MPLFWRVLIINGAVILTAALILVFSPATISASATGAEVAILFAVLLVVMAVLYVLLRRVFGPLERLARLMRRVDPMAPGRRIDVDGAAAEVGDLLDAFNDMLDRIERERRQSALRALAAQERERRRLARELHDELGQTLTGVVLQLDGLARTAPPEIQRGRLAGEGGGARQRRGRARHRPGPASAGVGRVRPAQRAGHPGVGRRGAQRPDRAPRVRARSAGPAT